MDKMVYVWDISDVEEPKYALVGHKENVCTIAGLHGGKGVVTGSWDKTARVWHNWECIHTLEGHEGAVWAVLELDDGTILTGSADKVIRRWKDGNCIQKYVGHDDCVRGLMKVGGETESFLSVSNDGAVIKWRIVDGYIEDKMVGHESFIYSMAVTSTGEIVTAGEDRTVRVWKNGENIETLIMPVTTIWSVAVMSNDDIVCGASDAMGYVFSRSKERQADVEVEEQLKKKNAEFAVAKKTMEKLDMSKIPGVERLEYPGTKDQQVIMVKKEGKVEAYQWTVDGESQEWVKNQDQSVGSNDGSIFNPYAQPIDGGAGAAVGTGGVNKEYKFIKSANLDSVFKRIAELASKNGIENTNLDVLEQIFFPTRYLLELFRHLFDNIFAHPFQILQKDSYLYAIPFQLFFYMLFVVATSTCVIIVICFVVVTMCLLGPFNIVFAVAGNCWQLNVRTT
ncbi:Phospholipase A-2-activating protein [Zancudomyces culisetae]|uniref:Phospholipase A-2-activating protein n=1 Tax=Zancudomyces culisetae TaxID=1213189 RepID=A0A1R1PSP8_ZANCU|nr:Phospholipase A-2-activating protein [Zancudomyces culisetae]|eukprot:OMH83949.1 Phospholipase A-2-activating protein [Zancudomyces culisetae]